MNQHDSSVLRQDCVCQGNKCNVNERKDRWWKKRGNNPSQSGTVMFAKLWSLILTCNDWNDGVYPSASLTTCVVLCDHIAHIHWKEVLTSARRDLCRGCRAAEPGHILCCSCCFLWPPAYNHHLSELHTLTPPSPTGRRMDPASPEKPNTCMVQCFICPFMAEHHAIYTCGFDNSNVNTAWGFPEMESFFF